MKASEMADPAIKLFGKTIPLVEAGSDLDPGSDPIEQPPADDDKDLCKQTTNTKLDDTGPDAESGLESKPEHDQPGSHPSAREKILKKPDKILPCPRCNSLDTKFCYYNNYNVNQPRHFCKNCQRYWTAGGTMRSVPVGAGRRKTKSSGHPPATTVLNFAPEAPPPLCEKKTEENGYCNGFTLHYYPVPPWVYPVPVPFAWSFLGKRSRQGEEKPEKSLWVPRALRVNPAALSRSQSFQEST